jgi:hypothetical protein
METKTMMSYRENCNIKKAEEDGKCHGIFWNLDINSKLIKM